MMDFDQAIHSHIEWKRKLASYLKKPDRSLKPAEIALDNRCELGKWIAGEGTKFKDMPEFASLRSSHARFHQVAADIVTRADSGENVSEEVVFGAKSGFAAASTDVVRSIMAIKANVLAVK